MVMLLKLIIWDLNLFGMEVESNKPGTGKIIIAESGGIKSTYSINEYSYITNSDGTITMLSGGTILRSMDSVYSGEEVSPR